MSLFDYLELKVLDHIVGKNAFTMPDDVYVGLSSTTPADDATNVTEPSAGSYARVQMADTDWNSAAAGAITNATDVEFPTATADWLAGADLTYAVLYDAASGGNPLGYGALSVAKPVLNGDTPKIVAGNLTITLD